jgi:hypothetical protein
MLYAGEGCLQDFKRTESVYQLAKKKSRIGGAQQRQNWLKEMS